MKKIILSLIPLFSLFSLFNSGCKKITDCEDGLRTDYLFDLPINISPAKDTFNVGDTIWIEQNFGHDLLNKHYNKYYKLENFAFKNVWIVSDLVNPTVPYIPPTINDKIGSTTISNTGRSLLINYDYSDNTYQYKTAIKLEKKGLFHIGFFSQNNGDINLTKCRNENVEFIFTTNGSTNNNFEMLKSGNDPFAKNASLEDFNKEGGYCFHVK